jgi:hypothetical protein
MRVGFDSDGVLDNFSDGVRNAMGALGYGHLWKSGPTPKSFWNYYEDWSNPDGSRWTFAQFKEVVDWGVDNGYVFTGHWREGAVEAVQKVADLGHKIIIITDRSFGSSPINSHRNTIRAYAEAGILYDEIHFTADKTSVPVDVMVEDKVENFLALEAAGVETYLITRAWNEDFGPHPRRISCVMDYADIIEAKTLVGNMV